MYGVHRGMLSAKQNSQLRLIIIIIISMASSEDSI